MTLFALFEDLLLEFGLAAHTPTHNEKADAQDCDANGTYDEDPGQVCLFFLCFTNYRIAWRGLAELYVDQYREGVALTKI